MKLIELNFTPNGNENGNVMEIIIDHDPDIFKPCYVHVGRQTNGKVHIMEAPPNISEEQCQQVINHAYDITDIVYDMVCRF